VQKLGQKLMKWTPKEEHNKSIKSWLFENINKINRPLTKVTKRRWKKIQIKKIRDGKGDITIDISEIQQII
jgi:hypothetical protein